MQALTAALTYAARGWRVFPVWPAIGPDDETRAPSPREPGDDGDETIRAAVCACPKGASCASPAKHPIAKLAPRGAHDATTDEQTIRSWWAARPDASIGLTLAGLLVIDVDPRHGGDRAWVELVAAHGPLPETPHAFTGGGGDHWLFQAPSFEPKGKLCPGVDVKHGPGAYVVAPPSRHASGGRYVWAPAPWSVRPAALPLWLAALLAKPVVSIPAPSFVRPNCADVEFYVRGAIESACSRVAMAPKGTRSDLVVREAFTLARFVKSGAISDVALAEALLSQTIGAGWDNMQKTASSIARAIRNGAK